MKHRMETHDLLSQRQFKAIQKTGYFVFNEIPRFNFFRLQKD